MKNRKALRKLANNLQQEYPFDDLNFRDFNGVSHQEYINLCDEVGKILKIYLKLTKKKNRKLIRTILKECCTSFSDDQ